MALLEEIREWALQFEAVGSQVTCRPPPPPPSDRDYLVLIDKDKFVGFEQWLFKNTFTPDGSRVLREGCSLDDPDFFQSFKREEINVIATCDIDFFNRFMLATALAKRFNLKLKRDRIALFQAVLYGVESEQ